tara:strand:- start:1721 stop:1906 length:186 start_codon:yes stop_codon:yes gene_type:complete
MKQARILNYVDSRLNYTSGQTYKTSKWKKQILERDKDKCRSCFNVVKDRFRKRKFNHSSDI